MEWQLTSIKLNQINEYEATLYEQQNTSFLDDRGKQMKSVQMKLKSLLRARAEFLIITSTGPEQVTGWLQTFIRVRSLLVFYLLTRV